MTVSAEITVVTPFFVDEVLDSAVVRANGQRYLLRVDRKLPPESPEEVREAKAAASEALRWSLANPDFLTDDVPPADVERSWTPPAASA